MDLRRIISSDITASAAVHLALLTLVLLFSDVRPFGAVTAEEIPVEIVTPLELPEQPAEKPPEKTAVETRPDPVPSPQPDFALLDKPASAIAPPPPAASQTAAKPQKQAAPSSQRAAPPAAAAQPASPPAAASAYKPPEPDITIKYQVMLGLPADLSPAISPPPVQARAQGNENFDAPATQSADIAGNLVAQFRRHLRTCSKLPAALGRGDDVKVKLRVQMSQDGKLAAEPILIEASASMKGPLLMQSAIRALEACQPYAMLPVDRYGEWKVLDLSFTPQDFSAS